MHQILENHQTIAVDCDEVLAELIDSAIMHSTGRLAKLLSSREQITDYYIKNVFQEISWEEIGDFFLGPMEKDKEMLALPTVDGAFDALSKLKKQSKELFVITARPYFVEEYTRKYIQKHFPDIFCDIHFASHFTEHQRNKSEICKEIGATVLIDDSMDFALDCAKGGIETLLLEKPWNRQRTEEHPNIHRFSHWNELI
ncbi:hypothetical protein CSB09_00920 [Candidatus Gracilibacteria bacterium]|nr:MAG: hypothetical protein CSB09_00920 [Candidatus Gracilibacteria bacterium]